MMTVITFSWKEAEKKNKKNFFKAEILIQEPGYLKSQNFSMEEEGNDYDCKTTVLLPRRSVKSLAPSSSF